jgi:hypothetical protein
MPDCCDKIALGHASARELYGTSWRANLRRSYGLVGAVIRVYEVASAVIETHERCFTHKRRSISCPRPLLGFVANPIMGDCGLVFKHADCSKDKHWVLG